MRRIHIVGAVGAIAIVSLAATSVHFYQQAANGQRLFLQVAGIIDQRYVDSLGANGVYEKAATGLVEALHDPYSELIKPVEISGFEQTVVGRYGGIGALVESRNGKRTYITKVFPHTPAEQGGVMEGDQIVAVDGVSVVGKETSEVTAKTKGEPGTKVNVTFQREGVDEPIVLTITRAVVHIPAVPFSFMIEPGVGYVPLQTFNETSAQEVTDAVMRLRTQGAKSFVLDMRGNGGGILGQALAVSSLFLKPDQAIVTVRGRHGIAEADSSEGPRLNGEFPLVVLTDEGSASATEIVAGALQDHDRALVVGARSFGKGLVQQTFPLDGGYLLKVTTGKWFTPSGRTIHRDRVMSPDGRLLATPVDTVKNPLPRYKSDGGRTLVGGGGIVPDVTVREDTISSSEQEFLRAVGPQASALIAALQEEANAHKNVPANFTVAPAWVAEVNRKLDVAKAKVEDRLKPARDAWITRELDHRIARVAFGDTAELRRTVPLDNQLLRALELLHDNTTQAALLAAARKS